MKPIPTWRETTKPEYHTISGVRIDAMQQEIDSLRTRNAELERDALAYQDLIYCVGMKHPNETRHETAKRYLRRAEESTTEPAKEQA